MCPLCLVSEDELMREADDLGVPMEKYVEDLLHALTGGGGQGGQRRHATHNGEEAVYSFQLTPDHCRLLYQKISGNVSVRKKNCADFNIVHTYTLKYCFLMTTHTLEYTTVGVIPKFYQFKTVKANLCR